MLQSTTLYSLFYLSIFTLNSFPQELHSKNLFDFEKIPNHYVVLVDASGSTVKSYNKRNSYYNILQNILTKILYEDGFGNDVPPFNPDRDLLSLMNFGIVRTDSLPAYQRLKYYDLARDFIHPIFLIKSKVQRELLKDMIIPQNYFELTLLSWAKQLSLNSLVNIEQKFVVGKTYLIMVHDGIHNQTSINSEIELIERWGESNNIIKTKNLIKYIDSNYVFSGGKGNNSWIWNQKILGVNKVEDEAIFIEVYEVVDLGLNNFINELKNITILDQAEIVFLEERENRISGLLTLSFSQEFLNLNGLSSYQIQSPALIINNDSIHLDHWLLNLGENQFAFQKKGKLNCTKQVYSISLKVPIIKRSTLLGDISSQYTFNTTILSELPFRCKTIYCFILFIEIISVILVIACLFYYIRYRYYQTHLLIKFPGLIFPVRIKRKNITMKAGTPIPPQKDRECFSIILPTLILQKIFLGNAEVQINLENGESLITSNDINELKIQFPIDKRIITWNWKNSPNESSEIILMFSQSGQESSIKLTFPKGIN